MLALGVKKSIVLKPFLRASSFVLLVMIIAACSSHSRQLYYWGSYEDMLYNMYKRPGDATPEKQVERLTRDLERTEAGGIATPPGLYAHLGIMYAALGNAEKAEQAFETEKRLFPESSVLIDGMLKRARESQSKP